MCKQLDKHYLVKTVGITDKLNSFTHTCRWYSLTHKAIEMIHYTLPILTTSQMRDKRIIALSKNLCKFSTTTHPLNRLIQVHLLFNFLNKCADTNKNNCFKKLIREYDLFLIGVFKMKNRSPHH